MYGTRPPLLVKPPESYPFLSLASFRPCDVSPEPWHFGPVEVRFVVDACGTGEFLSEVDQLEMKRGWEKHRKTIGKWWFNRISWCLTLWFQQTWLAGKSSN